MSRFAYALTLAAFAWWLCAWVGVPIRDGAMIAALVVLPWGALLMIAHWRGIVHVDSTTVYHGVAALFTVPCLLLAISAMSEAHLLPWWQALPLTALGGGGFAALVVRLDRRPGRKRQALLMMVLTAVAYAYGVVAEVDTRLDRAPPQQFAVPVLDKHRSGGPRSPVKHYLTVDPWGPRSAPADIAVDAETYGGVRRGDSVCISLWPGALSIPWYRAAACG